MTDPVSHGRLVAWRWLPLAALAGAAFSYGLHHVLPLDAHSLVIALVVVAGAAALAVAVGAATRPAERELPIVVTVRPSTPEITALTRGDLGFCAALHNATLDHGFFASLGHGFLRAYYATFVASPHAVALLAASGGAPVGLVVGAVDSRKHARWVLRHRGIRLAIRGCAMLTLHPRAAWRFARTRVARYRAAWRRNRDTSSPPAPGAPVSVLTHVAVVPGAHGAGIGRALVERFTDEVRERGADRVALVTHSGDAGAEPFYERLGWTRNGTAPTADGATMTSFRLDLAG